MLVCTMGVGMGFIKGYIGVDLGLLVYELPNHH